MAREPQDPGSAEVKAPTVIVTVPTGLGPVEIAVRHEDWGVECDIRTAGSRMSWTPLAMHGGSFIVRDEVKS